MTWIRSSFAAAVVALLAGGCAQAPVSPTEQPPAIEGVYDQARWRWSRNPDGRMLLAHTELQKCFVDPRPDEDFNERGFTVKRDTQTFGNARYDVSIVYQGRDFWIAVYRRSGAPHPLLGVYADGRCRAEAERIVAAYETRK